MDTEGKGEDGMMREGSTELHTLPYVKQSASGKLPHDIRSSTWCSETTWGVQGGVGGSGGRGCILMPDSCCYMADTNTTL